MDAYIRMASEAKRENQDWKKYRSLETLRSQGSYGGRSVIKGSVKIQLYQWFASSKQGFHPLKCEAIMIHIDSPCAHISQIESDVLLNRASFSLNEKYVIGHD